MLHAIYIILVYSLPHFNTRQNAHTKMYVSCKKKNKHVRCMLIWSCLNCRESSSRWIKYYFVICDYCEQSMWKLHCEGYWEVLTNADKFVISTDKQFGGVGGRVRERWLGWKLSKYIFSPVQQAHVKWGGPKIVC